MEEKAVMAYFRDEKSARSCKETLENMDDVFQVQVERFDGYPGDTADRVTNYLTGNIPSLAGITMGTNFSSRDASILAAAHPDASGMSGNEFGMSNISGFDLVMTVICDSTITEKVVSEIREFDGRT